MSDRALPLAGRVIALTRPRDRIAAWAAEFVDAGAETVLLPTLRLTSVEGSARTELEETVRVFSEGGEGWWVFTSASVVPTMRALLDRDPALRDLVEGRVQIAAVGSATERAARSRGFAVALTGDGSGARALAEQLLDRADRAPRVLHITSDRGLPDLVDTVERGGGSALRAIAVEHSVEPTLDPSRLFDPAPVELIVFASPSAAEALLGACDSDEQARLRAIPVVAIGETTRAALAERGFGDVTVAEQSTAASAVEAAVARLGGTATREGE